MAARREHGAPSALTVLEVAEGLRWTDPALGPSLAEHVRRLAGDDPAVRAAADRSVLRSLEDSDRHEDVVERGVPLLAEARDRGDRDDGASVLVELAAAATGLGDAGLARRLLDRLGPPADLPARIGAVAHAARAEACAADGDVSGTDAAADAATPVLFRVPQPDSTVLRARIAFARGVARRRSGDVAGALSSFGPAVSADPSDDVDGGRRSLLAAAEQVELLVETGRHEEARALAQRVLPADTPGAHVAGVVGRIRLAVAAISEHGTTSISAVAEDLEAGGRTAEAARAWELVAGMAESDGDLGLALASLRRGHALSSRARDAADRALRALGSVADGGAPLAPAAVPDASGAAEGNGAGPTRRRERRSRVEAPAATPVPSAPSEVSGRTEAPDVRAVDGTSEPVAAGSAEPTGVASGESAPDAPAPGTVAPPRGEAVAPKETATPEPAPRSTRDELAELLASLTRSVDSSRAAASAMGLDPAPSATSAPEPVGTGPTDEAERRSRHATPPTAPEPEVSRPTFDAFSTAPFQRVDDGAAQAAPPVTPLPDDRFAPVGDGPGYEAPRSEDRVSEREASSFDDRDDLLDARDPLGTLDAAVPRTARSSATGEPVGSERDEAGSTRSAPGWVDDARSGGPARPAETDSGTERAPTSSGRASGRASEATSGTEDVRDPALRATSSGRAASEPAGPGGGDVRTEPAPSERERPVRSAAGAPAADTRRGDTSSGTAGARGRDGTGEERPRSRPEARPGPSSTGSSSRQDDDDRTGLLSARQDGSARGTSSERFAPSASGRAPSPRPVDEYQEDLALTLATVLGEYHLPDVAMPARRERDRGTSPGDPTTGTPAGADVAVPSARRHSSGSMPVPAEQRFTPRAEGPARVAGDGPTDARRTSTANGRGRPPESGARLADLLAEAMDAFRHVGPEAQDGARGPGVGSRRA